VVVAVDEEELEEKVTAGVWDELLDELDEMLEDIAMAFVAVRLNKRNKFKFLIVFMINTIKNNLCMRV